MDSGQCLVYHKPTISVSDMEKAVIMVVIIVLFYCWGRLGKKEQALILSKFKHSIWKYLANLGGLPYPWGLTGLRLRHHPGYWVWGEGLLCPACLEERESEEKSENVGFSSLFLSSRKARQITAKAIAEDKIIPKVLAHVLSSLLFCHWDETTKTARPKYPKTHE